ncbi:MAG TPA: DNA-formamidopyrimidine glycosylase family protein, partial [Polyangia bacterium]
MPELPEVEVAARNLRRWAARRRVRGARADGHARRIFRPGTPAALRALAGARFE